MKAIRFVTLLNRRTLAGVGLALLLAGCGANYRPLEAKSVETDNGGLGQGPSDSVPQPSPPTWESLKLDGTLDSGRFVGRKVLSLDKEAKELVITMPLPANPDIDFLDSIEIPISKVPGMTVRIEPLFGGGSNVTLRVPLTALIKGIDFPPPARLPNGDPLPSVASGHMPAMAVFLPNIKGYDLTLYLDVGAVALFVPTKFDPMFKITAWIRNEDKTRTWGSLTTIPAKGNYDGGFFISVQLPDDIARAIDDLL